MSVESMQDVLKDEKHFRQYFTGCMKSHERFTDPEPKAFLQKAFKSPSKSAYITMLMVAVTNIVKNTSARLIYRLNAIKILREAVLFKNNQVMKAFLVETSALKVFLTCSLLARGVRSGRAQPSQLFGENDKDGSSSGMTPEKTEFIEEVLNTVEEWNTHLARDHKGKLTFFMMIHKAVFFPEEISYNPDYSSLQEAFKPTSQDPLTQQYQLLNKAYEELNQQFEEVSDGNSLKQAEDNGAVLAQKLVEFKKRLREVESRLKSTRTFCYLHQHERIL